VGILGAASESAGLSVLGFSLYGIAALGLLVPGLAVVVRRLHDLNKSGWYYFIALIPLVGAIILLVWFCTEGDRHSNQYGDDPKAVHTPNFDFDQPKQ
jgi:uncharacterized membrane protein YhaH (DUF805 family)